MKNFTLATLLVLLAGTIVSAQEIPIEVLILSPPDGGRLATETTIELQVNISPDHELAGVEVFLDNESLGIKTEPPFVFEVRTLSVNSVHRVKAVARTKSGATAISTRLYKEQGISDIAVNVDLVTVYVSVTDQQGLHIRDLGQSDFIIEEEGVVQDTAYFNSENTPLTAAILMDISSSMIGERIVRAQSAATDLVKTLIREEDQAMVLGFDHELYLYQPLTNDVSKLDEAIHRTGPNGGTALYDAVAGTARKLFFLKGKKAMIVLSDGDDTDSNFEFEEVLDYLQKTNVIVYTVGLQTLTVAQTRVEETKKTIRNLQSMADISGGQAYFPSFISHLPQIYADIGQDLRSQYTLAYYPKNRVRDGKWRNITVRLRSRSGLVLRHRKGYYAN